MIAYPRVIVALLVFASASGVALGVLAEARAPLAPIEHALSDAGARITSSPAPLSHLATRPDLVVVAATRPLDEAEWRALAQAAREGGELWILGVPLEEGAAIILGGLRALPGALHAEDGGTANAAGHDGEFAFSGSRALAVAGTPFASVVDSTGLTFRDTNGNGRLDAGEPAGPFTLVASASLGSGRVVVIGSAAPLAAPADLVAGILGRTAPARVLTTGFTSSPVPVAGSIPLVLLTLPLADLNALVLVACAVGGVGLAVIPRPRKSPVAAQAGVSRAVARYVEATRADSGDNSA